jgi:hypothetical protein
LIYNRVSRDVTSRLAILTGMCSAIGPDKESAIAANTDADARTTVG